MCSKKIFGIRHLQVLLLFFALLLGFAMRVNISMAIVAMTDKRSEDPFDWNMQTQSVVFSSFFWGYIVLQIPSGELAARFGGMILITIAIAVNSAVSLVIPFGAYHGGWKGLCILRGIQGLSQGCLFPTMHHLIGKWVPLEEKTRLGTLIYGGTLLGTGMQMIASGYIADYWGWPAIFYVNGSLAAIWVMVYVFLGADSPQKSRIISKEERLYIQTSLGHTDNQKIPKTPWKKLATSLPFMSLIVMHSGHNWGFWTLMTEMPSYMNQVLGVDIKDNGAMSALPYFVMYMLSFPCGFISDYGLKKKWFSINTCRKVSNSIGEFGPALALIALCHSPPGNVTQAVTLLTVVVGLNAGHLSGFMLVHIDMAPNFAGTMMGITTFFANVVSIVAPLFAGLILQDENDTNQWCLVFYVTSAVYIVTNTIFIIFGTSARQPWNDPDTTEDIHVKEGYFGIRHLQAFLIFLALVLAFSMRVDMNIAIVAMTHDDIDGSFNWNMQTQGVVLSSFLWGYMVLQIPGGELASKYGGKVLLSLCIAVNSGVSLTIPVVARKASWSGLCFCRVMQGFTQGCLFPTTHCLITKWVPIKEKGRLGSAIYGGSFFGTSMQLMVSGFIINSWGWPAVFYVNGTCGAIWFLCYMYFGSDSPQKSEFISPEERLYIQTSLGQVGEQKKFKTPWIKIFKSVPLYALLTAHCGHTWGFWTLITGLPTYMSKVLDIQIKESGVLSALPYLLMYVLSFPFGFLSDYALKYGWCKISTCRKVCNSIGEFGPAIMLIALCQVPPDQVYLSVALLCLVVGLSAGHLAGIWLTHIDMAPNFAGTIMGITNFFANLIGLLAPMVTGILIKDENNASQWHLVFYITSSVYIITNLVFIVFGSSDLQSWNNPNPPSTFDVEQPAEESAVKRTRARRPSAISG